MRSRRTIVVLGQEASYGGAESERGEHPAGDGLQVGLFHLLVRRIGQIGAIRVGYGDEFGLTLHVRSHLAKHGIGATVIEGIFAVDRSDVLECDDVEPVRMATGNGRRNSASIRRKVAVQAPIARASDRIAAADVTLA